MPVYNCAEFLGAALDSIMPQLIDGVEVLVVDGASTDRTPQIVSERTASCPQLRYARLERRGGIDADMAKSVELARGEYCWLFSGDDVMRPGALGRLLGSLDSGADIYLCGHTICDREMRFLLDYPIFRPDVPRRVQFGDPAARIEYLRAAVNTEALFSFMSGLVVRRGAWNSGTPVFMGSCWGHVARLLSVAERGLSVCYVGETWLDKRGGNDSFMDRGLVHRLGIAVHGFIAIAAKYFGPDSAEARQVRRLLRNELGLRMFIYARVLTDDTPQLESREQLDRLLTLIYSDRGLWNAWVRFVYRRTPRLAIRGVRGAYRLARRAGFRLRAPPEGGKAAETPNS